MIIGLIGSRGTVPTSSVATTSFLVNNWYLFECPSEIIQAFKRFQNSWIQLLNHKSTLNLKSIGHPTLGKIRYIILSHLHFDHWGGLPHVIHRILLLEREKREKDPLKLIIPRNSTIPLQQRLKQSFNGLFSEYPLSDKEFLYRFLTIEVGSEVRKVLRIIQITDGDTIELDRGYFLTAKENRHLFSGSFSYKLEHRVTKLKVEKAHLMGIPFNSTLKRIEKSTSPVKLGNLEVSRSEIFFDKVANFSYSGDTPIDPDLFNFFIKSQLLIHEATYLTFDELYHLDQHADLKSLIKEADTLPNLLYLIPIHFSIRYTDEEISNFIKSISDRPYKVINPLDVLVIDISSEKHNYYMRIDELD